MNVSKFIFFLTGTVSNNEFMIALEKFDFHVPNVSIRNELLKRFDHDGDGSINYLEFVNFCLAYAMNNDDEGKYSKRRRSNVVGNYHCAL